MRAINPATFGLSTVRTSLNKSTRVQQQQTTQVPREIQAFNNPVTKGVNGGGAFVGGGLGGFGIGAFGGGGASISFNA